MLSPTLHHQVKGGVDTVDPCHPSYRAPARRVIAAQFPSCHYRSQTARLDSPPQIFGVLLSLSRCFPRKDDPDSRRSSLGLLHPFSTR